MSSSVDFLYNLWYKITYENADPRIRDRLFMGSPLPFLCVTFCNFLILNGLQKFMKNRKGFKLQKLSLAVTFYIWIVNLYMLYKASVLGWFNDYDWTCEPVDRSNSKRALEIVQLCHHFVLFKATYVLELAIFILRKKDNLVTFYMYFHHLTFPLLLWIAMNYHPGGHVTFTGLVNSFNHVVLFGAVIIRTLIPKLRGNWFRYTVSYGQGIQFFAIIAHQVQLVFRNPCQYSMLILYAGSVYCATIAYLYFLLRKKTQNVEVEAVKFDQNNNEILHKSQSIKVD